MRKYLAITILGTLMACAATNQKTTMEANEAKIDSLIRLMTLEEKVHMIHACSNFNSGGVARLNIPELVMSDGPHGVRPEQNTNATKSEKENDYATYLPTGICLAATWDTSLAHQMGMVLGSEAKARGKDIILGPGVNIIRSPLNGRNFEYLSEDPYLNSELAVKYIQGVQSKGVSACVKHFAANNQEVNRDKVDVIVSERALREIYLPAFEASVKRGDVNTVMGSYNKVNGQYATHHAYLVNQVLKEEFGFKGILISDWSAVKHAKEALLNGTDIEMGTDLSQKKVDFNAFYMADSAIQFVKSGEIDEKVIDEKVRRILRVMLKTKLNGNKYPGEINTPRHQQLARKVAEDGIVLLKNDNILPIESNKYRKILVVGNNAIYKQSMGGGSSQVKALYEVTILEGIKDLAGQTTQIEFVEGYKPTKDLSFDKSLAQNAINAASKADLVIFVGGWIHNFDMTVWGGTAFDMEGQDKSDIKLKYGQEELIKQISEVNPHTVVVLIGGSNVEMKSWINQVPAVLMAWYPGMEGGHALANILFGKVSPSGKLPMTFADSHLLYPSHSVGEFPGKDNVVHYNEGIYVGYRYFDKQNVETLFPFGFGLSYTTFKLSDLNVTKEGENVVAQCKVQNTGSREGAEVVQFYVASMGSTIDRPVKELKGFQKIFLKQGEIANVKVILDKRAFEYYDEKSKSWTLEPCSYEIQVGNSSKNIELKKPIKL